MPRSRLVLYVCFALLALMAVFRFDIRVLVPAMIVIGQEINWPWPHRITLFGTERRHVPASRPRDTGDPLVRAYLVVGVVTLLVGLVAFVPFAVGAGGSQRSSMLFNAFAIPGASAMLLGAVFMALGMDLLRGGLGRPAAVVMDSDDQATIASEGPGLFRFIAPWLVLAGVADLSGGPLFVQACVALIGLALLRHLATGWPLFAALSAPAVAFYGWFAMGHAKHAAGPYDNIGFVLLLFAMLAGLALVAHTLGRAATGVLETVKRRTWAREPWLKQAVLGLAACVLAGSAHTHIKARAERTKDAEAASRQVKVAAASRVAAEQKAMAQAEAQAQRADADARVPGVSCHFAIDNSLTFEYQHKNPTPGVAGKVERYTIDGTGRHSGILRPAQVLDAGGDVAVLRQQANRAPVFQLPAGDVVFMSLAGARLLMLNPNGRVLELASFYEGLLGRPTMACINPDGTRWAVALGPVVKVFHRPAPDAIPLEVNAEVLDNAWFP